MQSHSNKSNPLAGFNRWPPERFAEFCGLLSQPNSDGQAARAALITTPPNNQERFAQRAEELLSRSQLPRRPALDVAELSDPIAPKACLDLGFEVLRRARSEADWRICARSICYLNNASALGQANEHTKIEAYRTAFETVAKGPRNRVIVLLEDLLPYVDHFLTLVGQHKRWDLADRWLPKFKAVCFEHAKKGIFCEVDRDLVARIGQIEEALKVAAPARRDPAVVQRDIEALLADAAEARQKGNYTSANLLLASAMRYLGCSDDPNLGGLGLYAHRSKLPLLAKVALVRVETLLEGATYQFHSDTEAQDRDVARNLCQGLSQLLFSKAPLPGKLRSDIARLINRQDLLDRLSVRPSGPDLSSWESPSV